MLCKQLTTLANVIHFTNKIIQSIWYTVQLRVMIVDYFHVIPLRQINLDRNNINVLQYTIKVILLLKLSMDLPT